MSSRYEIREQIEELTQTMRIRLNLSTPLHMIDVIKKLGINCNPVENVDYDARLSGNKEEGYCISYNKTQSFVRQQFSIAHELGHLILHTYNRNDSQSVYYRRNGSVSQIEWEANEFAAALLMPREEFIDFCKEHVNLEGKIYLSILAENFKVSEQAVRVRGSVLGLWKA